MTMKMLVFLISALFCLGYAFAADINYKLKQGAVIDVVNVSVDTLYNSPAVSQDGLKGIYKRTLEYTSQHLADLGIKSNLNSQAYSRDNPRIEINIHAVETAKNMEKHFVYSYEIKSPSGVVLFQEINQTQDDNEYFDEICRKIAKRMAGKVKSLI
jgi:hypothetical protein